MEAVREYKILEQQGLFYPLLKTTRREQSGGKYVFIFFWKSEYVEKETWVIPDGRGYEPYFDEFRGFYLNDPIEPFTTLEAAKAKIKLWQTPDKIHEI